MAQVREPGEGRERRSAGAALDPERAGARERTPGRPEMGAESAGGGESWERVGDIPSLCPSVPAGGPERVSCVRLEIKGSRGREQNLEQL